MSLGALSSYALTLTMGRLLEAAVSTLFLVYGNDKWRENMRLAQPDMYNKIDDAYRKVVKRRSVKRRISAEVTGAEMTEMVRPDSKKPSVVMEAVPGGRRGSTGV
eukprot:CAMPEP_0194534816 /NCGR_PEP_ID=MMETSP0253-20130528/73157_1 /TAXON_ID=2966 /ORGANISM="Noctiluca scintillans" /LENGTH=104 /DNA_ID=CAMNT_0039380523 /DNA_START=64 /DNA_END=375 /DNA_ORIENTATION=+